MTSCKARVQGPDIGQGPSACIKPVLLTLHAFLRLTSEAAKHDVLMAMRFIQEDGSGQQLITPPLDGTILPGVTRDSILRLARHWADCEVSETHITIGRLRKVGAAPAQQAACLSTCS